MNFVGGLDFVVLGGNWLSGLFRSLVDAFGISKFQRTKFNFELEKREIKLI